MEGAKNPLQVATPREPWTPPVVEYFNLSNAEVGVNVLSDENPDGTS